MIYETNHEKQFREILELYRPCPRDRKLRHSVAYSDVFPFYDELDYRQLCDMVKQIEDNYVEFGDIVELRLVEGTEKFMNTRSWQLHVLVERPWNLAEYAERYEIQTTSSVQQAQQLEFLHRELKGLKKLTDQLAYELNALKKDTQ